MRVKAQPAMAFVGDGNYEGDGGAELQRLWEFAPWKRIANCPGRYTIRHSKRSPMEIGGVPVTSIDTQAFVSAALGCKEDGEDEQVVAHQLQSERCKDPVQVVVFATGGGVITYCKTRVEEDSESDEKLFIHTLNTASGLERKLCGLQLTHVLGTQ